MLSYMKETIFTANAQTCSIFFPYLSQCPTAQKFELLTVLGLFNFHLSYLLSYKSNNIMIFVKFVIKMFSDFIKSYFMSFIRLSKFQVRFSFWVLKKIYELCIYVNIYFLCFNLQ